MSVRVSQFGFTNGRAAPNGINLGSFTDTFPLSPRANWGPNWIPRCIFQNGGTGDGDLTGNSMNPGAQWIQGALGGLRYGEGLPLPLLWMNNGNSINQFAEVTISSFAVPASVFAGSTVLWTPYYPGPNASGTVASSGGYFLEIVGNTLAMGIGRIQIDAMGAMSFPYNVIGGLTYTLGQVARMEVRISGGVPTFSVFLNGVLVGGPTADNNGARAVIGAPGLAIGTSLAAAAVVYSRFSGGKL